LAFQEIEDGLWKFLERLLVPKSLVGSPCQFHLQDILSVTVNPLSLQFGMPTFCSMPKNPTLRLPRLSGALWVVFNIRNAFATQRLDTAMHRKIRDEPLIPWKLGSAREVHLIQIACSKPPEDRSQWALQSLADRLVEWTLNNESQPHTEEL
jgi:hypothetical protein